MRSTVRSIVFAAAITLLTATVGNAQPVEIGTTKWGKYLVNKELSKQDGTSVINTVTLIVSAQGKATIGADAVLIQVRADCVADSAYLVNWKAVFRTGETVATGGPASNVPAFADLTPLIKPVLRKLC